MGCKEAFAGAGLSTWGLTVGRTGELSARVMSPDTLIFSSPDMVVALMQFAESLRVAGV